MKEWRELYPSGVLTEHCDEEERHHTWENILIISQEAQEGVSQRSGTIIYHVLSALHCGRLRKYHDYYINANGAELDFTLGS